MHRRTGPIVVIADDDPDMRDLISYALTDAGYVAKTAMDVPAAMGCLRFPGVVAAVLDMLFINSGGHSGLDLLRRIRSDSRLKHIPVIVVTGFPLNRAVVAEVEALHAELWQKPFNPLYLAQRLNDLVH